MGDMAEAIMAKAHKLTAAEVKKLRAPGKHGDGNGLWLVVTTKDRRAWVLRYMRQGRSRELTLGNADVITLADARQRADDARKALASGVDPIDARKAERAPGPTASRPMTFAEAADAFISRNEAAWRNLKHRAQWRSTLDTYASPHVGDMPVADIQTRDVERVLTPIWTAKPETASRVRGRVEAVLDFARVQGWRDGPNPAAWRGHLQLMLPPRNKVRAVVHHAALDWPEAPAFTAALRQRDSMGARALEFAILTAARSGEVRGARWTEIDLDRAVWTVPASRMKAKREHRVPLSSAAVAILRHVEPLRDEAGLVFPGQDKRRPLSDMTLTAVLRRMGRGDLTAHGFRSTFRDWCAEQGHPADIAEAALAHTAGDKTVQAYQRGDMLERRRRLMTEWARFCAGQD